MYGIHGKGFGNEVEAPDNVVGILPVELEEVGAAARVGAAAIEGGLGAVAMRLGQERAQASRRRWCRCKVGGDSGVSRGGGVSEEESKAAAVGSTAKRERERGAEMRSWRRLSGAISLGGGDGEDIRGDDMVQQPGGGSRATYGGGKWG